MPEIIDTTNNFDIYLRLLQFKPSWTLHCLLRFKNLPYISENTSSQEVIGLCAPVIIDGNYIFTEKLGINHLSIDRILKTFTSTSTTATNDTTVTATTTAATNNASINSRNISSSDKNDNNEINEYIEKNNEINDSNNDKDEKFLAADLRMFHHVEVGLMQVYEKLDSLSDKPISNFSLPTKVRN